MSSDQEQDLFNQFINHPPEDEDDGTGITRALGLDAYFDDAAADEVVNSSSVHEQPNAEQIPKVNTQSESHNTATTGNYFHPMLMSSSKSRSFDNLPEIRLNSAPPANTDRMYDTSDSSQYVIKRRNTLGLTPSDISRLTGDSPFEENVFSTQENNLKNDDSAVNAFSNNFLQRQYYEATEALSGHRERWENDVAQDNFRYNDADSLNKWKNDEGNTDVGVHDDMEGINSTSMQESRLTDAEIPQHAWDNKDRNPTQTSFNPLPPYSKYPQDLNILREYMSKSKVSREKVKHIKAIMKKNEPELNESSQETSTRHISYAAIKAARRKPVKKLRKSKLNSDDSDNRDTKSLSWPSFVVPPVTSTATVENTQIPDQEEQSATQNPDEESRNLQNFKSQFFPDDNDP